MVSHFEQGVTPGPFYDSLIRNPVKFFSVIRRKVVVHINIEEAVLARNSGSHSRLTKLREAGKTSRPMKVNETST